MESSKRTEDHEQIRRWVEARNESFDQKRLAFLSQERTAGGVRSRFNRFVSR
jgi:hypothetical protein